MAMKNGPFISDFPSETSIHRDFPLPLITGGYVNVETYRRDGPCLWLCGRCVLSKHGIWLEVNSGLHPSL